LFSVAPAGIRNVFKSAKIGWNEKNFEFNNLYKLDCQGFYEKNFHVIKLVLRILMLITVIPR